MKFQVPPVVFLNSLAPLQSRILMEDKCVDVNQIFNINLKHDFIQCMMKCILVKFHKDNQGYTYSVTRLSKFARKWFHGCPISKYIFFNYMYVISKTGAHMHAHATIHITHEFQQASK